MATLIIDGEELTGPGRPKTLGDLLLEADGRFERHGRIVSVLRLDGVDEPAFREPQVMAQEADAFDRIEVESATPEDLAGRCLIEAGTALEALADAASDVGMLYRMGDVDAANRQLASITEGIGTALAITGAASLGLGVDLAALTTPDGTLGDLTAATSRELEALIAAQLEADWEGTADRLDAGLAPVLRRWGAACSVIAPGRPAGFAA